MFALTIALGPVQWRLLFKTNERANSAYELISNPMIENLIIEDDFGQKLCAKAMAISGFIVEDMNLSKLAQQELLLYNERVRHGAMQAAQSDPQLRAQTLQRGPAVLTPMGMNGR